MAKASPPWDYSGDVAITSKAVSSCSFSVSLPKPMNRCLNGIVETGLDDKKTVVPIRPCERSGDYLQQEISAIAMHNQLWQIPNSYRCGFKNQSQ
jgi:hypothetical protein